MTYEEKLGILLLFGGLYLRVMDGGVGWNILAMVVAVVGTLIFTYEKKDE